MGNKEILVACLFVLGVWGFFFVVGLVLGFLLLFFFLIFGDA